MISFLHGAAVAQEVKRLVGQPPRAELAVAYWGAGSFETLGIQGDKPVRILCDLMNAGCNPAEIAKALTSPYSSNVKVRHVPRLHSKVYISEKSIIVGSPNASDNGLGESPRMNIEAAILVDDVAIISEARTWFEEIWSDDTRSQEVDHDLIERSKKIPRPPLRATFLEELVNNPAYFGNSVTLVYIDEQASPKAMTAFQKIAGNHYSKEQQKHWTTGSEPFYQAGCSKDEADATIKPGDYIINCADQAMVPETIKEPGTIPIAKGDCIVLLNDPSKGILGLPFPPKHRRMLYRAVQRLLKPFKNDPVELRKRKDQFAHSAIRMSRELRRLIENELAREKGGQAKIKV
jgi:hypothetical protein